ncbi:hypothetical protein KTO58_15415 [Chitinophaga pendula]|uniref:AfsR/SARP family transcriptional regulator n=1 Tax=Chitinophaga TaxID=79328 RepID=UPI000BAE945E|nr:MULTISPECIES: hypothetical protein [Chitinophaga]ASZ11889.1 hypothetical protein CK934_13435 [Chitinophaga sp. MD30]UCJ05085.1 hypothetical protein KTO58_15415 [Chitinophaga pendula]
MRKTTLLLYLLVHLLKPIAHAQSYGLRFLSHEVVQENRTSLQLTPAAPLCFDKQAELTFSLKLRPGMEIYFGYVFRLIIGNKENIDLIYNQRLRQFDFIVGEQVAGSYKIDTPRLYHLWNTFRVQFDAAAGKVALYANGRPAAAHKWQPAGKTCCQLYFGTNNLEEFRTGDIPPMNIRDIQVNINGHPRYHWPLDATSGTQVVDILQRKVATVSNPVWLKDKHQNWELAAAWQVQGSPGIAFDRQSATVYITTADSIYDYALQRQKRSAVALAIPRGRVPAGNQSIFIPALRRLCNFYIDEKIVTAYDSTRRQWDSTYKSMELTEYWQANKFFNPADTSLYIVGGYGQLRYKNKVQRYHFPSGHWDSIPVHGDTLMPKYLSGLGVNDTGDTAYILGGYGSATGEQVINPRYNYDLTAFSTKNHRFKNIYHLPRPDRQFCFANSLVIDSQSGLYYALTYPNDVFNSSLQLIRGSLHTPTWEPLGGAIPYAFYDIASFADLWYSPLTQQLVAVTLYTDKTNTTSIKIYTIQFPPDKWQATNTSTAFLQRSRYLLLALLAGAILVVILTGTTGRRRKLPPPAATSAPEPTPEITQPPPAPVAPASATTTTPAPPEPVATAPARSRIFLFGPFEVINSREEDLTRLFSPLLKEMFLLITVFTLRSGKGVSSNKLYATLWEDKSSKDAQNNRSVNMVKLKGILDKLGHCAIQKESDRWLIQWEEQEIEIDLARFFFLLVNSDHTSKNWIREILSLVNRGELLLHTDYDWLDDIRSEISGKVLNTLLDAATHTSTDAELQLGIAHAIFLFDPVNEEALHLRCKNLSALGRHSQAKTAYEKFRREYAEIYGEDYHESFQDVISE